MTDDELLLSHARDLKTQCADRGMLTHTAFLDLHSRSLLASIEREHAADVRTFYYGGYADAERTVAVFVPSFYGVERIEASFKENPDDDPLCLLRLDKDRFTVLSHRDYLGALMGLSIKREMLGDIVPDENGAFLVCLRSIRPFLLGNLHSAGRATLTVTDADFSALSAREQNTRQVFASVASLRLDNVVAAAFSLSRSKAEASILGGLVYVNDVQCLKEDKKISQGDKLVLRGKGKAVLSELKGESKKGRIHIEIRRYV